MAAIAALSLPDKIGYKLRLIDARSQPTILTYIEQVLRCCELLFLLNLCIIYFCISSLTQKTTKHA